MSNNVSDFLNWQETFKDSMFSEVQTMLPAKVVAYDHITRKAIVQILIKTKDSNEELIPIPPIQNIPCSCIKAGGFIISLPIKAGDTGRLCFFSRDTDANRSLGDFSNEINLLNFNYSNSFFVPDYQPFNINLSPVNANDLYIGSEDGETSITFSSSAGVTVTSTNVNIIGMPMINGSNLVSIFNNHIHYDGLGKATTEPTSELSSGG